MSVFRETLIAAPPEQVWAALVTFDDYAKWHPMARIKGEPGVDAPLRYSIRTDYRNPKFMTVDAQIVTFEPQRVLAFRYGLGMLLSIHEQFSVETHGKAATRLVHRYDISGMAAWLAMSRAKRNLTTLTEAVGSALKPYLEQAARRKR